MNNLIKILISLLVLTLTFGQSANAGWEPDKEVEIVAHAKETSSTVAFARSVIKVIEQENLLPNGVKLTIIRGARGGKARNYVLNKNKDPHVQPGCATRRRRLKNVYYCTTGSRASSRNRPSRPRRCSSRARPTSSRGACATCSTPSRPPAASKIWMRPTTTPRPTSWTPSRPR